MTTSFTKKAFFVDKEVIKKVTNKIHLSAKLYTTKQRPNPLPHLRHEPKAFHAYYFAAANTKIVKDLGLLRKTRKSMTNQ